MATWELIARTGRQLTRFEKIPAYPEGLYDLGNRVYAWMVPNGSWGESNAGLVVGEGESLLIDTLWDLNWTREMLRAMEPITTGAPIKYLANTHADGDHIWGNELVKDAEVIMTVACDQEAREMKPAAMTMLGKTGQTLERLGIGKAKQVGKYFHNMVAPYDFKGIQVTAATRTFSGEMVLEVGGREVRLIETGPAHTQGDMMVYVPDAKTLFGGDMLFAACTPVIWVGPVEHYIAALDKILALDVEVVVPGHGQVSDKSAVAQGKAYLEYIRDETGKRFEAGMSARDAAFDIATGDDFSRQVFATWDSPERIMTNVHVIYRHLQGQAKHLKAAGRLNILRKQALLAHHMASGPFA
jgi:cyclase